MCNLDDLIGKKYREDFEEKTEDNFNCWEISVEVFKRYGIEVPQYDVKCHEEAYVNSLAETQRNSWKPLLPPDLPIPCLIVFNPHMTLIGHVGVYVGNGMFVHSMSKKGVCLERINHPLWKNRIEGYYSLKKEGE